MYIGMTIILVACALIQQPARLIWQTCHYEYSWYTRGDMMLLVVTHPPSGCRVNSGWCYPPQYLIKEKVLKELDEKVERWKIKNSIH